MNVPKSIQEVVDQAAEDYQEDVNVATDIALSNAQRTEEWGGYVDNLIRMAIRSLVYASRHKKNVRLKRQTGYYNKASRPRTTAAATTVLEAYDSVFEYHMAGRTLGELRGKDLEGIARHEESMTAGHMFNYRLALWLTTKVSDDEKVRDKVTEAQLQRAFNRIYRETQEVCSA